MSKTEELSSGEEASGDEEAYTVYECPGLAEVSTALCPSVCLSVSVSMSAFLTKNSPDLCALTLCIMSRKNNSFLSRLPGMSANSNQNCRRYNFRAFARISGNIKFPENLQPYVTVG